MKRFLMVVLLSALLPLSAFALCIVQTDYGCAAGDVSGCNNSNCSTTTFVADATGTFDLIAKVDCPTTMTCKYCAAQICLYETLGANVIARLSSNDAGCTSCSSRDRVNLRQGVSYTMQVCLTPCNEMRCGEGNVQCHSDC